tara:strand:- start:120 stop:2573 length:2454 start_codon:yes stop_codon:yes gene_type:complete
MKIAFRLPLTIVGCALAVGIAVGVFSYNNAAKELQQSAGVALTALRESRSSSLQSYLNSIEQDLDVVSSSREVREALDGFSQAYGQVGIGELRNNYIGRKNDDKIPAGVGIYARAHEKFHPWFELIRQVRGYYDVFLVNAKGDLVYTFKKETDFATNLVDGEWKKTGLARVVQAALKSNPSPEELFADFEPYKPSNDDPASFIANPIRRNDQTIGVLAFQMPIAGINRIMHVTAGMGESGETYLVGGDYLMRSDSRFSQDSTILKVKVQSPSVDSALAGNDGLRTADDYRGISVLSAYQPIKFRGTVWALLSEMDTEEVLGPVVEMRTSMLIIGLISALLVALIGYMLAASFTTPLTRLSEAFSRFGRNRVVDDVPYTDRPNEIGAMAREFDGVIHDITKYIEAQKQAEAVVAEKEEQMRTAFENMTGGIFMVDTDLKLRLFNARYKEFFELPDHLVHIGSSLEDIVRFRAKRGDYGDGDPEAYVQELVRGYRDKVSAKLIDRVPSGRIIERFHTPIQDGTVIIFNDITDRVKSQEEIAEKTEQLESLSGKLSKYLSPQVYESIFAGERDVVIATERKKLTVFFSDIKDFTATTEDLEPEELTHILNDYLTNMTEIAIDHGATVDKYIGDAMVMFFGDPTTMGVREDALACVRMAVAMQRRMVDLRAKWNDQGYERPFHMRIGINTGFLNVGNFGSDDRMDYTIIGGEVNLAARLEGICEPDGIALANETFALVKNEFEATTGEPIQVKGIARDITPYFVQGIFDDLEKERPFISSESDAMRLFVDLRMLDEKGRLDTASELEGAAARIRGQQSAAD